MFLLQNLPVPTTLEQLSLFENRLLLVAFEVFLVYHTFSLICRMLGIRENWIKSLFRAMVKALKSSAVSQ